MITKISDKGITFIKSFEGVRLKAYRDVKGVLTIGIGHTKNVKAGQTCTVAEAYRWMREDLAPVERYVAKMMPNNPPIGIFIVVIQVGSQIRFYGNGHKFRSGTNYSSTCNSNSVGQWTMFYFDGSYWNTVYINGRPW